MTPEQRSSVPEARLQPTADGIVPQGEGWFVLNARDVSWTTSEERGQDTGFEGEQEWTQLGFRIQVLAPGQRGLYHGERGQEDFLVVSGECVLVIDGLERRLKAWDFVHCPLWTKHVFVGAGDERCVIVMAGGRSGAPHTKKDGCHDRATFAGHRRDLVFGSGDQALVSSA